MEVGLVINKVPFARRRSFAAAAAIMVFHSFFEVICASDVSFSGGVLKNQIDIMHIRLLERNRCGVWAFPLSLAATYGVSVDFLSSSY